MRYLNLLALLILTLNGFGQGSKDTLNTDDVVLVAENGPAFPGGRDELYKFINSKLKYPKDARKSGIQGKVVISFIVERNGTIDPESINVEKSVHPSLDNEAIRVIKLMPKWTPASHSGRNVRARTGFPITFSLN